MEPRGAGSGRAGARRGEQPPVLGGAGAGCGGPSAGRLLRRCLGADPAQPVWPLPAQGGSGGPGAHLGSPRPPRAWLGARPLPGASGKCEEPPPPRGCQGKHGPAQTLCQWVGGGGRVGAPLRGLRTGPPPLRQAPVPGICRRASPSRPASLPPSPSLLSVHLHPCRGYRPARLRASAGRRGGTRGTTSPPRRCHRPPAPSLPARPLGPRFAIAAATALPPPAAVLPVSLPACFPRGDADGAVALTSRGEAETGAGRGPRAQPGRRRGRKDRVVIAARGSCLQRALLVPGAEPHGRHR